MFLVTRAGNLYSRTHRYAHKMYSCWSLGWSKYIDLPWSEKTHSGRLPLTHDRLTHRWSPTRPPLSCVSRVRRIRCLRCTFIRGGVIPPSRAADADYSTTIGFGRGHSWGPYCPPAEDRGGEAKARFDAEGGTKDAGLGRSSRWLGVSHLGVGKNNL
jgi:hypothetical protein